MTESDSKSEGVPVSLPFTKFSGMFVGFLNENGEERWLKETSVVGGMTGVKVHDDGVSHPTVFLTVRESVFRTRRGDLQAFVRPSP